jgi:hypothetical protein
VTPLDDQHDDQHDELRDLLTDAVSDVEPVYRLSEIQARVHRPARRGWYAVGGAILAAAAVVTAVSLSENDGGPRDNAPPASEVERTAALYFVGDTPAGPRLYREFQKVSGGPLADLEAITEAGGPDDPDYRTTWPAGSFESVTVQDERIDVELGSPALESPFFGQLVVQQVVFTLQAATGEELPVQFTENGQTLDGTLYQRAPQNKVLSLVSISDPSEGLQVRDSFVARGRADSFEATVPWQIVQGEVVVQEGFATAEGSGDRLYAWESEIDVSDLAPGSYTFVAQTDDPSGGAEGFGPFTDTRTIIVD